MQSRLAAHERHGKINAAASPRRRGHVGQAVVRRRHDARRRGVAMLETAAVLLVLTPLFLGMVQYGRVSHATEILTNLAREGARFGSQGAGTADRDIAQYVMDQAATTYIGNDGLVVRISPALTAGGRPTGAPISVTVSYDLSRRLFMPARWMVSRYENNDVDNSCSSSSASCWVMRPDANSPNQKSMESSNAPVRNVIAASGPAVRPMYIANAEMLILSEARVTAPPPAATPTHAP